MVSGSITEITGSEDSIEYTPHEFTQTISASSDQNVQFSPIKSSREQPDYTEDELLQPENRFRSPDESKGAEGSSSTVERKELREFVDAVITRIYENSVHCNILLGDDSFEIQLPVALMPENIFEGMPVSIGLDKSSGYVTPVVQKREIHEIDSAGDSEELDLLISNL